jgi:dihydrofolate synthase/folylpolyglutamate synthase
MRYHDAIKFIYGLELSGIKLGLDNITRFLDHLGNPQRDYQSIHVAGTNGKGSVCAMLFSILKEAGYRTGAFTSPHLVDFRERIRTNLGAVDKRSLAEFVTKNHDFIVDARITFFEISAALAFWYFRKVGVEIAVIEVGLGGRLDATNVLTPELSVITHIDYDHTKILGTSLRQIAIEKAGIIRKSVPLVTGERRPELYQLFREVCRERGATISRPAKPSGQFTCRRQIMDFSITSPKLGKLALSSNLVGAHQIENAAIAVKCVEVLNQRGIKIGLRPLKAGMKDIRWPARFQTVCRRPLILLDGAHNPDGARALVKTFQSVYSGKKAIIVCGFLERPDLDTMLQQFALIAKRAVLTRPANERAAEIEGVIWAAVNAELSFDVQLIVADAVDRALKLSADREIIVICGSLYTIGEAISHLGQLHRKRQLTLSPADITFIDG